MGTKAFKDWYLSAKLGALIALGMALTLALAGYALVSKRDTLEAGKRAQTRNLVEAAHGIVVAQQAREAAGELSREEAQKRAKDLLRALRYSGSEYFWVNDMQPRMVMYPIKPELDGQDLSGSADPTGKKLFVAFVDEVKRNGAVFVDYMWPKPGSDKPVEKIS